MTTMLITDPASLQRLGMLIEAMEARRVHLERVAEAHRAAGNRNDAHYAADAAIWARVVEVRVRKQMDAISALTADDAQRPAHVHTNACPILDCPFKPAEAAPADEPPTQLVPFVDWLRAKIGPYLPWAPVELWQAIGVAMLGYRPTGGRP